MYLKRMNDGYHGIYTDTLDDDGRHMLMARMPTLKAARTIISTWEYDQALAEEAHAATMQRIGSPQYGLASEMAIDRQLVIKLKGVLTPDGI